MRPPPAVNRSLTRSKVIAHLTRFKNPNPPSLEIQALAGAFLKARPKEMARGMEAEVNDVYISLLWSEGERGTDIV